MSAERAAALVLRWARFYTRRLPAEPAERRVDELRADLHDHLTDGRAHGVADRLLALAVLSRMLRGMTADLVWRHRVRPDTRRDMKPFLPTIAVALLAVAVGVAAGLYGGHDDSPGLQLIGVLLIAGASFFAVRSARRRSGNR